MKLGPSTWGLENRPPRSDRQPKGIGPHPSVEDKAREAEWLGEFRDASVRLGLEAEAWMRGSEGEHPYFKRGSVGYRLSESRRRRRIGVLSGPPAIHCEYASCKALPTRYSPFEGATARVCERHFKALYKLAAARSAVGT